MIACKDLGLAAYLNMKDFKLVSCEGRTYTFDCTPEAYQAMKVDYANSSERKHDCSVMFLRTLQNGRG